MKIIKLSLCISMVGAFAALPTAYANEVITNCTQVTGTGGSDSDTNNNKSCAAVTVPFDFGDASDPAFPVLLANGGARHQLGTDVYLGKCVDGDSGELQGAASADDADESQPVYGTCETDAFGKQDDEDGVAIAALHVGDTESTVQVTANAACKLNAWVDWNQDGSWGGAGEQVFLDKQLASGVNNLTMDVPAFAAEGKAYTRFRCSTVGGDGIGGEAADGEVEDYALNILPKAPTHSLGNMVWVDDGAGTAANANNGKRDAGEVAVPDGVVMELRDKGGNVLNEALVENGYYLFSGLATGEYSVCVAHGNFDLGLLKGYTVSTGGDEADANADGDNNDNGENNLQDGLCSNNVILDGNEPTGEAPAASGNAGDDGAGTEDARSNLTVDFGVLPPAAVEPGTPVAVGQRVWIDLDANGKQDAGEPGVAGVTVTLLDASGKPATDLYGKVVAPQTTDADGNYLFGSLSEGSYLIKVTPPPGYLPTTVVTDPNNNDNTDSNGVPQADGSVVSNPIDLKWGEEPQNGGASNITVGFGFIPNLQIPTLSQWGVAIMGMLLATAAFFRRRRED